MHRARNTRFSRAALGALAVALLVPASASAISFGAPTNFTALTQPRSVAMGHFDNNATLDLAVANFGSDRVSILLGNGNGTFTPQVLYVTGTEPRAVAVADFDGDGDDDVAVANQIGDSVSILLGNGNGTFGAAVDFPAGNDPDGVSIGDFNGDGDPDLALANAPSPGAGGVSVLLGGNLGTFSASTFYPTGPSAQETAIGDYNGDTEQDLAVANANGGTVSILLGNGNGAFAPAVNFAGGGTPSSIVTGDFNGATGLDLAVGNFGAGFVSILTGNGLGTFGAPVPVDPACCAEEIKLGEFTGDADPDIVATTGGGIFAMAGGPGAGFGALQGPFPAGNNPFGVAVGLLDGDARPDLAVANDGSSNVSILLGQAEPTLTTVATNVAFGAPISDTATLAGSDPPTGGATITFEAWNPNNPNCNGNSNFSASVPVTGNGVYAPPAPYPTSGAGDYHWIVSYSGDVHNAKTKGTCGDAGETSTVAKQTPTLSTVASSANVGQNIHDTATLAGGANPTGQITFKAYAPGNLNCGGNSVFTDSVQVNGNGNYVSANFPTTAAGGYRWTAEYDGDNDNAGIPPSCNGPNELSTVLKVSPSLTTIASDTDAGGPIRDKATLSNGFSPTGQIVFKAWAPDNPTCAGAPAFTSAVPLTGNGNYQSGDFATSALGQYRWVASYAGDDNNNQVAGGCGDATEISTARDVTPPETTITKKPTKKKRRKSYVRFESSEANSTFTCILDGSDGHPCTSPQNYADLDRGSHSISVAATDAAGNTDTSPASAKFFLRKPH